MCERISKKVIERHHLRWVFEKARVNFIDFLAKYIGNKYGQSFVFSAILFLLIIFSFFISILAVEPNIYKYINKNKKNYIFLLAIFFLIISFYSFRFASELRYSFFEMFFLSLSIYSSFKRQKLLFLISIILATLNRESGILISSIWFIVNGIDLKENKISILKKETIIGIFFIFASIFFLIIVNYRIFSCGFNLDFFSYKDPNTLPVFNNNIIRSFNIIFSNFIIIILLLYFFYVDFQKQFKLILIILFYNLVFLFFTPADHVILRIMFAPIFLLYVYQFLEYDKEKLINK